jgi:hypothetical protein
VPFDANAHFVQTNRQLIIPEGMTTIAHCGIAVPAPQEYLTKNLYYVINKLTIFANRRSPEMTRGPRATHARAEIAREANRLFGTQYTAHDVGHIQIATMRLYQKRQKAELAEWEREKESFRAWRDAQSKKGG